jgi:hypothetical protein
MSSDRESHIILVPHPGAEAEPTRETKGSGPVPWNTTKSHRRKFLECGGEYLRLPDGPAESGTLRFWCEYEPPTVATRLSGGTNPPTWVNTIEQWPPLAEEGATPRCGEAGSRQNTDPWIWSPGFVWTICRHHHRGRLSPMVRELAAPDLVLFGSVSKGRWLLDTVLVVGDEVRAPQTPPAIRAAHRDATYAAAVLDCLDDAFDEWRPIPGRAYELGAPAFSFVPALVSSAGPSQFERPDVAQLLGTLRKGDGRPPAVNSAQAATRCTFEGGASAFWTQVADHVRSRGLVLGVSFEFPVMPTTE